MCGIAGFIDPEGRTPSPERVLARMGEALVHRGPDDAGELVRPPAFFAHRRLSIVDTSPAGRQPFTLAAGGCTDVTVMANAEVYNHAALRDRIAACFPGAEIPASDCAVLPWLWCLEREKLPEHVSGLMAVAAWDASLGTLLLARDPAGQKPLYYASTSGGGIAFASEPKALLVHPDVSRDVDPIAVRRYLAFDAVPGEATIYSGIRRLPAGGRLLWHGGRIRVDRHFPVPPGEPVLSKPADARQAFWEALSRSVHDRLMADVPLGLFLSGGLDSTAIACAMAEHLDASRIKTFSIGFDDPSFDESASARAVAGRLGTDHHEERLDAARVLDLLPGIVSLQDEPFADPSIVPMRLLAAFTVKHVKVALGGDGGDELLLGYPTFLAERAARLAAKLPAALRRQALERAVDLLPVSTRNMSLDFKLRRFLLGLDLPPAHRHVAWRTGIHPGEHAEALPAAILRDAPDSEVFADVDRSLRRFDDARPGSDPLDALAWTYFEQYLGDLVLAKVDRATMAEGLEARSPFLDRRVLAVAARIPAREKLHGTTTKKLLRDLLRPKVPAAIVSRPKKGFGIPVAAWLRGPLEPWMRSVLDPAKVERGGLLRSSWTSRLVGEHTSGRANHAKALWSAICLELWRTGPYGPGAGEGA